jgi:hypothetical protein
VKPPNDALRFHVGRHYTIRTDAGDILTGRCSTRSLERVWLVSDCGQFSVHTGAIAGYDNLEPVRPVKPRRF